VAIAILAPQYRVWYYDREEAKQTVRANPITKGASRECALARNCQCRATVGKVPHKHARWPPAVWDWLAARPRNNPVSLEAVKTSDYFVHIEWTGSGCVLLARTTIARGRAM